MIGTTLVVWSMALLYLFCSETYAINNSTLIVVPGMSLQRNRTLTVLRNLEILYNHSTNMDCLIHHYSANQLSTTLRAKIESFGCRLQYFHESNHYADYLKSLLPFFLERGGDAYVMILLDDVELHPTFRLQGMLDIMLRNGLSVASPGVEHASMTSTTPYKHSSRSKQYRIPPLYKVGATVQSIEIFATIFTVPAWRCFWDLVEPRWNPAGWGYDLCFYNYCREHVSSLKMGVVYGMTAEHHKEFGRVQRNTSLSTGHAGNMMAAKHPGHQYDYWVHEMKAQRNITLVPVMKHSRGKKLV
mmetsp:Transcript_17296/g.28919  ORF Transcript_17296/g.28919 Transcript_17296/m.28919 type:complete len:301 (+) Transcript_17296:152-1054(+)